MLFVWIVFVEDATQSGIWMEAHTHAVSKPSAVITVISRYCDTPLDIARIVDLRTYLRLFYSNPAGTGRPDNIVTTSF